MENELNTVQAPCKIGCRLYVSISTDGYCSRCYKEYLQSKQQSTSNRASKGNINVVYEYLRCLSECWEKEPKEFAKTKIGRQTLRNYVATVRSSHKSLISEPCDLIIMKILLHSKWSYRMSNVFETRSYSSSSESFRQKIIATLPRSLRAQPSRSPYNPVVNDLMFFEKLFDLRVSWRSFNCTTNNDLRLVYEKYKAIWMFSYATTSSISDAVLMWLEAFMERIVSIVTEWELCGIRTDEDDIWLDEIPSEIVPAYVQNSLENDELYQMRMFQHDQAKNSFLFYGLPVGTRIPSHVSTPNVDFLQAKRELSEAAAKVDGKYFQNETGMAELGRIANQYLRAAAMNDLK